MTEPTYPNVENGMLIRAEQYLNTTNRVLSEAAELVAPEAGLTPLEVFAAPNERRDDDKGLVLDSEQEHRLRQIATELGFGRPTDKTAEMAGLPAGYVAVIEGGQAHKVKAQEELSANAGTVIFSATPHRKITKQAERESGARILGVDESEVDKTEYEVVRQIAESLPGFAPLPEGDITLPFSYDIYNNFQVGNEESGQFVQIGTRGNRPVIMLRIDKDVSEEAAKQNDRKQPGSAEVMSIVSSVMSQTGDYTSSIGFITSSTYEASRSIDAFRSGLKTNRQTEVISYGTARLAAVKGEDIPAPGPINQLPGELYKIAKQQTRLANELQ
ncbi:MAG: hypothetical protein QG628_43 [Patescibacteria group bacterium]|jgi:hypothetical protein|nr:hypothetical protein [Patescibacteria group bacterium]